MTRKTCPKFNFSRVLLAGLVFCLTAAGIAAENWLAKYPPAYRDSIVDNYHGTIVPDPYRWLEDPDAPRTVEWVEAQNKLTAGFVDTPERSKIKEKLAEGWNYARYSLPYHKGNRYFYWKNDGLQNHSVFYMQDGLNGEPGVVIDPNILSEDGTTAVSSVEINDDGTLMVYGLSEHGSDWSSFYIRNLDSVFDYAETIEFSKWAGATWRPDNSGFYYSRFSDTTGLPPEEWNLNKKVYWHTLGTPQSEDVLIYSRPDQPEWSMYPNITDDGRYLLLHIYHGTSPFNRIYYRPLDSEDEFIKLLDDFDAQYHFIDNVGSLFYFKTNLEAPRERVIAIDINHPERENWLEVIPERQQVLSWVKMISNQFVTCYMQDAYDRVEILDLEGNFIREIELPTTGSVAGVSGEKEDTLTFIRFTSFLYPPTTFLYNFRSHELSLYQTSDIDFDPSKYVTRQVFCESEDGTRVPMFITHRKGLERDGRNPTVLNGYGGFQVSMKPRFSVTNLLWFEQGGIYALACLRGGSEYGEAWHKAGMLENKQNVYDDFIAAAEWLIDSNYTSPERLAIEGGSNGGLLVAAAMTQRPDLFGAVICAVPLTDMLRYHRFTIGFYWTGEYGNAEENPEHFRFLYAYSPYHNVREGETYPPTLILTADTDDRVVPAHGKKFAAALQAADSGENPILLRVETKAGHGGGKPITKRLEEQADIYAFLFKVFDMTL